MKIYLKSPQGGFPFHPFLLASYSVVGIFAQNANEISPAQIVRPLLIILLGTGILLRILYKKTNNLHRAGLLTLLILFLFVYYGHVYFSLMLFPQIQTLPGRDYIIFGLWCTIILFFASPMVWREFKTPHLVTTILNITSVVIIIAPSVTIALTLYETASHKKINFDFQKAIPVSLEQVTKSELPDIYYIILDGYGRNDLFRDEFAFDNSGFTDWLEDKGFYVAEKSQSNYMQTQLSLASTLNMQYLDSLSSTMGNSQNRGMLTQMTADNSVALTLQELGYQYIAFDTAHLNTKMRGADIFYSPYGNTINELEGLLLANPIFKLFIETTNLQLPIHSYATQRTLTQYAFEKLPEVAKIPKQKFVFVHILAPHPPFVFDKNGNPIEPDRPYFIGDANGYRGSSDEYLQGYVDEVIFINEEIKKTIMDILENAERPPVIILQGDHGPGLNTSFLALEDNCHFERFSILNAYYIPSEHRKNFHFYPGITPVNSFRILFNYYLNTDLELLPDKQFYATWTRPYQFIDVTELPRESCQKGTNVK